MADNDSALYYDIRVDIMILFTVQYLCELDRYVTFRYKSMMYVKIYSTKARLSRNSIHTGDDVEVVKSLP